jgi:hypothetical protein
MVCVYAQKVVLDQQVFPELVSVDELGIETKFENKRPERLGDFIEGVVLRLFSWKNLGAEYITSFKRHDNVMRKRSEEMDARDV